MNHSSLLPTRQENQALAVNTEHLQSCSLHLVLGTLPRSQLELWEITTLSKGRSPRITAENVQRFEDSE